MREEGIDLAETEKCPEHPRRSLEAARESLKSYQRVIETALGNPDKGKGRASQNVGPESCMRREIKLADWGMHEKK